MSILLVHDAIHVNVSHLPKGQAAGYTTGSPDIKWTPADWATHTGAVRICQDGAASDHTADVLDVEQYAATNNEAAAWYKQALTSYETAARPGQRHPAIYCSAANVTPLVNALITGGVAKGPNLWVANWNLSDAAATAIVDAASGPFPVCGVQFDQPPSPYYDTSVFSSSWLTAVSHVPAPPATPKKLQADGIHSFGSLLNAHNTSLDRALYLMARDPGNPTGYGGVQRAFLNGHGDIWLRVPPQGMTYWVG